MFYRIYVEAEIGHDLELYTILESKYKGIRVQGIVSAL